MFNEAENQTTPEELERMNRHWDIVGQVVKEMARVELLSSGNTAPTNKGIQQQYGLSELDAQRVLSDAERSYKTALQDAGLTRLIQKAAEEPSE